MLNNDGLILIAHSDSGTLMTTYTMLDDEGYFVAPCFSRGDLLQYVSRYKPELIMTNNPPADDLLLDAIKERSPKTRVVLLPDVLPRGSNDTEMACIVKALGGPRPQVHLT